MRFDLLKSEYVSRNYAGYGKKLPIDKIHIYDVGFGSKIGDPSKYEYWDQDILNYAATMTNQSEKSDHDLMYITSDFVRGKIRKEQEEYNPKNLWCECRNVTTEHFISVIEKMESKEILLMNKPAHHIPNIKKVWKELFSKFAAKCIVINTRINVQNDSKIFKKLYRTFKRNSKCKFIILINRDRYDVDIKGFSWISHEIYLISKDFIENENVAKNWEDLSEHAKWFFTEEYLQLTPLGCIPKAAYVFPFDNCFQFETFCVRDNPNKTKIIEPIIYINPNIYLNSHFYKKYKPKTSCDTLLLKMESKFLCDLIALNGLLHNDSIIHSNVDQMLQSFLPVFFEKRFIAENHSLLRDLATNWLNAMEKENERKLQNHRQKYGYEMENEISKRLDNNVLVWERKSSSGDLHKIKKFKSTPINDNNNNNKKTTIYSIESSKSDSVQNVELNKNGEFSNQLLNRKDCKVQTPKGKFSLYGFKSGFIPFQPNQQKFQFCLIVLGIEKDAKVKTPKLPESKLRTSAATPLAIFPFEVTPYLKRVLKYSNKKNDDLGFNDKQGKNEIDSLLPKKSLSPFEKFVQLFTKNESKEEEDEYISVTENRIIYGTEAKEAKSIIDNDFTYSINKKITIPDFDSDDSNDCGKGIHFFLTQMEAIEFITGIKCVAEDSIVNYDKVMKFCSFDF